MELTQIEQYLRDNAYSFYKEDTHSMMQDKVYLSILHSLDNETLSPLIKHLDADRDCPSTLYYKALGVQKSKNRAYITRTFSTEALIAWYSDKKSGKVSASAKELMTRYRSESAENQQAILSAFLMGGKKEIEWAARRLRANWIEDMAGLVGQRWEQTHNPTLGFVVLQHMPDDFVMKEQEVLASVTKYAFVCARLGNKEGFHIDESKLSVPDYLYVYAKLDKDNSEDFRIAVDAILDVYLDEEIYIPFDDLGLILWSLGRLGMTDTIIRLKQKLEDRQQFLLDGAFDEC